MTKDIVDAYVRLQDRCLKVTDLFSFERLEAALDELLQKPQRQGAARRLTASAWGNAGKHVRRRRKLAQQRLTCERESNLAAPWFAEGVIDGEQLCEANDQLGWFMSSQDVRFSDRQLLLDDASGHVNDAMARNNGCSLQQLRVRVSHARRRVRTAWQEVA